MPADDLDKTGRDISSRDIDLIHRNIPTSAPSQYKDGFPDMEFPL